MRYIILVFLLSALISCDNGAPIKLQYENNSIPPSNQLVELFRNGQHTATLITPKELSTLQQRILKKFLHQVSTNEEIQTQFDKLLKNPETIKPGQNLGLNKKETQILLSIFTRKELSTEQGTVSISINESQITFKGSGRLSILDSLTINPKDTLAVFRQNRLEYYSPDSSYQTNEFMPDGEHLENIFPFNGPNGILSLLPTSNKYVLVVGRLMKSEKTYLYLDIQEPLNANMPFNPFYSIILD